MMFVSQMPRWTFRQALLSMAGAAALAGGFSAAPAQAETIIEPFIAGRESFTDNVNSEENNKKGDFLTTFEGGVNIDGDSSRTDYQLLYTFSKDVYASNSELNGDRHSLLADGEVELVEDWIKFNADVAVTEENVSRTGATTATERSTSQNVSRVINYGFGPTVEHSFGRWFSSGISYDFSGVEFKQSSNGPSAQPSEPTVIQTLEWTAESGPRFNKIGWGATASWEDTDRESRAGTDDGSRSQRTNVEGRGSYAFNNRFSGTARVGNDKTNDSSVAESNDGVYYFGGVTMRAKDRLNASLELGRRYGDPSTTIDVTYTPSERTRLTLEHSTSIETQQQRIAAGALRDANGVLISPNGFDGGFITQTTKNTDTSFAFSHQRERTGYNMDVKVTQREFSSGTSSASEDATLNVTAGLTHQLSRKLGSSVSATYTDTIKTRTANTDQVSFTFTGELDYQINESITGTMSYNFLDRKDDTGPDIRENVLSVGLRKTF